MNKTGLVLNIENNTATLVTSSGEFVKVIASKSKPKIGETYSGAVKKENNYLRYLATVAALLIIFIGGGGTAYAYYTPTATVLISINPSIELKINRFDKIIKVSPKNTDGETLLKSVKLKNKNIDEALTLVVEQAKKDNFINEDYIAQGKTISVKIYSNNSNKIINIDKFEKTIDENKINTDIDNNGEKSKVEFSKKQAPAGTNNNNSKDSSLEENNSSKETSDKKNKSNNNENSNKKDNSSSKEQSIQPSKNQSSNKNSTSTNSNVNTANNNSENSSVEKQSKTNEKQDANKNSTNAEHEKNKK